MVNDDEIFESDNERDHAKCLFGTLDSASCVESDNECDYAKCLFDTLDSVSCDAKRRDVNFVTDLVGRVYNFIEDDDFTEA